MRAEELRSVLDYIVENDVPVQVVPAFKELARIESRIVELESLAKILLRILNTTKGSWDTGALFPRVAVAEANYYAHNAGIFNTEGTP